MCWNYTYIILILFSTVVDYFAGIFIYNSKKQRVKTLFLLASLITNLGFLFVFKYFNFFGQSLNYIFDKFNIFYNMPTYNLLLPVGISFYTFQTLSYTIDMYKENRKPEYHFGKFALYVSFFPQLVAGPIERSQNLLPQFHKNHSFDYERVRDGILLMCWGFFKKVVIADRLAEYVNLVYNNAPEYQGMQMIIATFFFSFQIYCDFSGYSDIAIGSAKIMGYDLMTNFKRPYLAQSIREFWQRWHISLSTWFRDYVYIPLGGNRVGKWRWYYNLFITFLISGLWHGAEWTFVIWGGIHGFYLVFAIWTTKLRESINNKLFIARNENIYRIIQILTTFVLVYFSWIFFRANNFNDAMLVIKKTLDFSGGNEINLFRFPVDLYISIAGIILLLIIEIFEEQIQIYQRLKALAAPFKWFILAAVILAVIILGVWDEADFLYFQF